MSAILLPPPSPLAPGRPPSARHRAPMVVKAYDGRQAGTSPGRRGIIVDADTLKAGLKRNLAAVEERLSRPVAVLLEVNAGRDPTKHGFAPEEVPALAAHLRALRHVQVRGLMTMAALAEEPERCRPTFAALRQLRDRLRQDLGQGFALEHLSMGMSNDFEVAVE